MLPELDSLAGAGMMPPPTGCRRVGGNGATHVYTPCPPGSSQPEPACGSCEACEPGTYTDNATEKTECTSCPLGRYDVSKGTARCTSCSDPTEPDKPAFWHGNATEEREAARGVMRRLAEDCTRSST